MARRGQYSASGRMAAAGVAVLYLLAASTAFVPSSGGAKGLRGVGGSSRADFAPFHAGDFDTMEVEGSGRSSLTSGAQAVLLAAVFGLLAGLAPVRAEEAAGLAPVRAEEAAPAQTQQSPRQAQQAAIEKESSKDLAARRAAPGKADRVKRALEQLANEQPLDADFANQLADGQTTKRAVPTVKRTAVKETKSSSSGFTFPSFSVPEQKVLKKKVIISPADEIDDDERSMAAPNQPLLFLFFATPVAIYLFFYIFGSLNII